MNNDYKNDLLSKTISLIRIPATIMVVFIHNNIFSNYSFDGFPPDTVTWLNKLQQVFFMLTMIAVPTFFVLSGFLFFYSKDDSISYKTLSIRDFVMKIYPHKLIRRFFTLVIPYILWTILYVLLNYKVFYGETFSITHFLHCFYDLRSDVAGVYPALIALWYIRDLIAIMIISPIFLWLIKTFRIYIVFILGVLWYVVETSWGGHVLQLLTGSFSFSIGAYFSIMGKNMVYEFRHIKSATFLFFFFLAAYLHHGYDYIYIQMGVLTGIIALFNLISNYIITNKSYTTPLNPFIKLLSEGSFFVFCFHLLILGEIKDYVFKYLLNSIVSPIRITILYILPVLITVSIGWIIYYLLHRFCPKLCGILTGGR